jgi:hypothetical protein
MRAKLSSRNPALEADVQQILGLEVRRNFWIIYLRTKTFEVVDTKQLARSLRGGLKAVMMLFLIGGQPVRYPALYMRPA